MLHIGIIGLGAIGQRLIKQFSEHPDIEIAAVCDQLESLTRETAASLGGAHAYTEYQEIIADPKVNLVYVAVPPKYHFPIVMEVLQAKKHVLCEKPLANSVEEAKAMLIAAKEAGVVHAMNFPLNYGPAATKFAELIHENDIGKLRRLQLTMHFPEWPRPWQKNEWVGQREQGGFVLEVGVHFIQQTLKIFGDIKNIQTRLELPGDSLKCETGIIATAELEDGTPVLIEGLSEIAGKEYIGFTAFGSEGTLALENWGQLKSGKIGAELETILTEGVTPNHLIDEVVKAIQGQDAELYDFEVGYKAQVVLEELRKV
ncbi:Gfo/Idh/MocA family protein [Robertmurraya massiliosenegalensis]|uniref:Gfo/Idh/MocA family protein n=1 Tax=Robertmurraya massiliosenegalensis TaxID=1287657 RepID=UPI0003188481|nr:Gfo/Idh/MocA family oxidoreductase [Robertmurraya massiliosenegalensis]